MEKTLKISLISSFHCYNTWSETVVALKESIIAKITINFSLKTPLIKFSVKTKKINLTLPVLMKTPVWNFDQLANDKLIFGKINGAKACKWWINSIQETCLIQTISIFFAKLRKILYPSLRNLLISLYRIISGQQMTYATFSIWFIAFCKSFVRV